MAIGEARQLFSLAEGTTYLDHGAFGVAPNEVLRVAAQMREWVEAAPRPFFDNECRPRWREAAALVAKRFSARAEDLALVDNVTDGVNAILRSLSFAPGDEILITSMTYGAVANAARRIAGRQGARVVEARLPYPALGDEACVEAVRAAIGPKVKLAILDHIVSPTALVLPVAEMVRTCRERGVAALVDGAHVPGHIPLDIEAIDADWYVANLHKWHFVPRACGFLWARRDRQEGLASTVLSWDIDKPFPYSFEWTGTRDPSSWLTIPAAFAFMDRFGADNVRKHNHDLAIEGAALLAKAWGVPPGAAAHMTGAMVLVPLPARSATPPTYQGCEGLQKALWNDHRIACACMLFEGRVALRVCAQIYNTIDDYEKLARAVRTLG